MLDEWLATFAFSRTVRHAPRDFSDAVLLAELLAQLLPAGAVALHNYPPTGRFQQKLINWDLLNRKVLASIHCELSRQQMEDLAGAAPGAISVLLVRVKQQIDKGTTSRPLGKPPRSPTKKSSLPETGTRTAPQVLRTAKSVPKPHITRPNVSTRSELEKKTSGSRSPSTASSTSTVASSISPARSAPSTPTKTASNRRVKSPVRSDFSLLDYLPTPNERPTPDSLSSTYARVLQMGEPRARLKAPSVSPPPASPIRHPDMSGAFRQTRTQPRSLSLHTDGPFRPDQLESSHVCVATDTSFTKSSRNKELRLPDVCEGSFVRLDCLDGDLDRSTSYQLARVVRTLASGDCLIQLFRPTGLEEEISSGTGKTHPTSFVSTPHFIECSSSQVLPVTGIHYDHVTCSWIVKSDRSSGCERQVSPAYPKPSSPLSQYTTTVLSRHKFGAIGAGAPLELRAVEPGSLTDSRVSPQDPSEMPDTTELRIEELCVKPTVFAPVTLDLRTILESLPPKFPPPPKTKQPRTSSRDMAVA